MKLKYCQFYKNTQTLFFLYSCLSEKKLWFLLTASVCVSAPELNFYSKSTKTRRRTVLSLSSSGMVIQIHRISELFSSKSSLVNFVTFLTLGFINQKDFLKIILLIIYQCSDIWLFDLLLQSSYKQIFTDHCVNINRMGPVCYSCLI